MSAVVAFEPHQDDVALFAAFTAQEHSAHVVTVLESRVQEERGYGISQQQRWHENDCAMHELGLSWEQWPYLDSSPDWGAVAAAMRILDDRVEPALVLAPAVELGGHDQHTKVGELAADVFGNRVAFYTTYVRGSGRTVTDTPVVGDADQIARKLRALACYRSQIGEPSTRPWFLDGIVEYLA